MDITPESRVQPLYGHTSPESAYVVDDYPYGFRLRCKIRYWLEYKPGHGYRLCSQTTNPKVPGEGWNKPKPSTYVDVAGCMYLDAEGHVHWAALGYWADAAKAAAFVATFPGAPMDGVRAWSLQRIAYSRMRASGKSGLVMNGTPVVMTEDEVAEARADVEAWTALAVPLLVAHLSDVHGVTDTDGMSVDELVVAHKAAHAAEKAASEF